MNSHEDAAVYELAASEIAAGKPERGILAKAFSAAMGQEEKTKALYIQYRVEQLKAEAIQRFEEDARRKSGGRKGYLAELKKEFEFIAGSKIPEHDVPSEQFSGSRHSLPSPVRLSDVAEALAMLEFRLIDAVKAGLLSGVRENDDEWWISKKKG